jgi:hypothetical protein
MQSAHLQRSEISKSAVGAPFVVLEREASQLIQVIDRLAPLGGNSFPRRFGSYVFALVQVIFGMELLSHVKRYVLSLRTFITSMGRKQARQVPPAFLTLG